MLMLDHPLRGSKRLNSATTRKILLQFFFLTNPSVINVLCLPLCVLFSPQKHFFFAFSFPPFSVSEFLRHELCSKV